MAGDSVNAPRPGSADSASPWRLAPTSPGSRRHHPDALRPQRRRRRRALSRVSCRKIRQNLFFAFIYNVLALPLAGPACSTRSSPARRCAILRLRGQQLAAAQALEAAPPTGRRPCTSAFPGKSRITNSRRSHPAGVAELVRNGHRVSVEAGAGAAVGFADAATGAPAPHRSNRPPRPIRRPWCSGQGAAGQRTPLAAPASAVLLTAPGGARTSRAPCSTGGDATAFEPCWIVPAAPPCWRHVADRRRLAIRWA